MTRYKVKTLIDTIIFFYLKETAMLYIGLLTFPSADEICPQRTRIPLSPPIPCQDKIILNFMFYLEKALRTSPVADPGGRPPYGPEFSQFHAVFQKNPMLVKPWIRPCSRQVRVYKYSRFLYQFLFHY